MKRKRIFNWIAFLGSLFFLGGISLAHADCFISVTYFVSATDGSDSNDGLTPGTAWKTITYATTNGIPKFGDRILVLPGVYNVSGNGETFSLGIPTGVILKGSGWKDTIIDAENTGGGPVIYAGHNAVISGFTITGGRDGYWGCGIWIDVENVFIFENLIDCRGDGNSGICCWNVIGDNWVSNHKVSIANNIIIGSLYCALALYGCEGFLINNTFDGNMQGYWGLDAGDHSEIYLYNNIFTRFGAQGSGFVPAYTLGSFAFNPGKEGKVYCYSNDIWTDETHPNYDPTYVHYYNCYPGFTDIHQDPLFVCPFTGDFHLSLGSPCIDAGDNGAPSLPAGDFEGDSRKVDGDLDSVETVDMGADELLPEIAARFGNVKASDSCLVDVLKANGSAGDNKRIYSTTAGAWVRLTLDAPPLGPNPADFALYAIAREAGISEMALQPYGIGISCIPMPLSDGDSKPPPCVIANTIGYWRVLGAPILPGVNPAPCTVFYAPLQAGDYTLQAYMYDNSALGVGVSLTNGIVIKVR